MHHQSSTAWLITEALSLTIVAGSFLQRAIPLVATLLAIAWYSTMLWDWWRRLPLSVIIEKDEKK